MFPPCRDLTLDDVKDLQNMKGNAFDVLAAVAGRAKQIYDVHVAALEKKRKVKTLYADAGEPSTSAPPKKTKRKAKTTKRSLTSPPPPLPEEFHRAIREMARGKSVTPPTMVIHKFLYETDVSSGHNRLSIPFSKITDGDFLTEEEKRCVRGHDVTTKKKKYLKVTIIEPSLRLETVKFSRWDMPKHNGGNTSSSYVIIGNWKYIVFRNNLSLDMEVQLWSFRVHQHLCFALVCLPPQKNS